MIAASFLAEEILPWLVLLTAVPASFVAVWQFRRMRQENSTQHAAGRGVLEALREDIGDLRDGQRDIHRDVRDLRNLVLDVKDEHDDLAVDVSILKAAGALRDGRSAPVR